MQLALPKHISTFVDLVRYRAEKSPDKVVYTYLTDGESQEVNLTYGQLDRKARAIAAKLGEHCKVGDRALMMYPSGLEFIIAFFGCLYAGVIAVPAYPPKRNQKLERLQTMVGDCLQEKRNRSRTPMALPLEIKLDPISGTTINLSTSGALLGVESDQPFSGGLEGKHGRARVSIPGEENLEIDCRLVHIGPQQIGLQFLDESLSGPDAKETGEDAAPGIVLTASKTLAIAQPQFEAMASLRAIPWLATDEVDDALAESYHAPTIGPNHLAFLQYTSGSTGQPKGVMVSQYNMLVNCATIAMAAEVDSDSLFVSWLPLFHDMGLINGVFLPIYGDLRVIMMDPTSFLQKPIRWLQAISKYRGTHSGAPNFAYELCARTISPEARKSLDLSSWRMAFSGSEPIRTESLLGFADHFEACGFHSNCFLPSYGMAEATLMITGEPPQGLRVLPVDTEALRLHRVEVCLDSDRQTQTLVGCGHTWGSHTLEIVDPQTLAVCAENQVGEIWFSGPSKAQGYWNKPELNREMFHAYTAETNKGPFLRTGDLGFQHDGVLYITGRLKDVLIIRGRNYYPQDIEQTVSQSHEALQEGSTAAFTVDQQEESLVIVQEVKRTFLRKLDIEAVTAAIRQAVAEQFDLQLEAIELLKPGRIPKTSSGKIQRRATRDHYQADSLDAIPQANRVSKPTFGVSAVVYQKTRAAEIAAWLAERVYILANVPLHDIDHQQPLTSYGLDSIRAMKITGELEQFLHRRLPQSLLWDYDTIETLANHLTEEQGQEDEALLEIPTDSADVAHLYQHFPLNGIQQVYWLGRSDAFELGNIACHFYSEFQRSGLDIARLEQAWQRVIDRHAMLRAIVTTDGKQHILADSPTYRFGLSDCRQLDQDSQDQRLLATRKRMSHQIFPLDQWPLFDIHISQLPYNQIRIHLSFDMLVADFWSFLLLYREWEQFYENPNLVLPELEYTFRDYVLAEQGMTDTPEYLRSLAYWQARLDDLPPAPALPLRSNAASIKQPRFVRRSAYLSEKTWQILRRRAQQVGLTGSIVLCAAYAEILRNWSKGQQRFCLVLTQFNRIPFHYQVNQLVGDFTSLTLLEVDHRDPGSFEQRTRRLQKQLWRDLDHRAVDGVEVLRRMAQAQGQQQVQMPVVFTSALGLQGLQGIDHNVTNWLGSRGYSISQTPQVWLEQQVYEEGNSLIYTWDAIEDLFHPDMLDDMFEAYGQLLNDLATDERYWQQAAMGLLPRRQKERRAHYNDVIQRRADPLMHEPFLEQAKRRPQHLALVTQDMHLDYQQLAELSLYYAHTLRDLGARPNQHVAIVMEKGWQQVVAALAILQAGAAYCPIAPELPQARRDALLAQTEAELVLTQERLANTLTWPAGLRVIPIEAQPEHLRSHTREPLASVQKPTDLAYTIFTSGSTGVPKGVMTDHRGPVNTILDINQRFQVVPEDRMFGISALNFDLSVYDIFGILAAGATLVLPDEDERRDPARWLDWLDREQISLWNSVPQLVSLLADQARAHRRLLPPSLRLIMMSGDWIPLGLPELVRSLSTHTALEQPHG